MKTISRCRDRKENHVVITIEGKEGETDKIAENLLRVLRKEKHSQEISYCITKVDYLQ